MCKLKTLLGIGLTLVMLAALTVGLAVPAAADPGTLKWSVVPLPKVDEPGDYVLMPDSDVGPTAIAADGETLFAALDDEAWQVMKSTDGGYSWKLLEDFRDEADTDTSRIVDVVVSPDYDEDLTVFVATENFLYQSVDGGKRFVRMTTGWSTTETITDLDVALDGRGRLAYMVGTKDVELGTSADATAEWFADKTAPSGNYSVELTLTANPDDNAHVEIYLPSDTTLADLEGMSYKYFVDSAGSTLKDVGGIDVKGVGTQLAPVYQAPYLSIQFSVDGVPGGLVQHEVAVLTGDTWETDTIGGTENWHSTFEGGEELTFAKFIEKYGTAEVPSVWLQLDKNGAGAEAVLAHSYVDAIEINGVTYDLEPADVYVLSTATGISWESQGIGDYDVLAVGFSPFFADDQGIAAVVTDVDATKVRFSFDYIGTEDPSQGWPADIGDAGIHDALGANFPSSHARIAFPDDFDSYGIGNNVCWVGIYAGSKTVPAEMNGDVYKVTLASTSSATDLDIRGVLTTLLPTQTNIVSIDVCGDAEDANIIVGTDYWSGVTPGYYFLTYRSEDGGETWIPSGTKSPTGGDGIGGPMGVGAWTQVVMSPDFLTDGIAYAGTSGDYTSAFSRTKDSGATWNQISLIDYGVMDVPTAPGDLSPDREDGYAVTSLDAAGFNADKTLHIVTQTPQGLSGWVAVDAVDVVPLYDNYYGAVWKRTNAGKNWERIWCYANPTVTDNISKLDVIGDETIFAIDKAAGYMWRSSDMGATWPKKITTKAGLDSWKIVSPTTIYTGHADGGLWWSTKSGAAWQKPESSEIKGTVGGIAVRGDTILASNYQRQVFISSDGGETFERVGVTNPGADDPQALLGVTTATDFDSDYDTNYYIYAAMLGILPGSATAGLGGIWRCEVDVDDPHASEWVRIDEFQGTTPYAYDYTKVITGPAGILPSNILYGVDMAPVADGVGGMWRSVNPDAPIPYPYFETENKGLHDGAVLMLASFDVFPTVMFCFDQKAVAYNEQVVMFTDTLSSGVPLAAPADGAAGVGTLYEGQWTASVVLAWAEMTGATKYQYQIAIDEEFLSVLPDSGFTAGKVASLTLSPNTTYYWRVRVAYEVEATENPVGAPLISPWSEKWSFKTVIGPSVARPDLEAPEAGEVDVLLSPTFEWSGIEWAEKYEFELGTDPGTTAGGYFASTLVSLTGANALISTAWKCDIDLEYETRYYWHVKAFGVDTETPWSDVGTFVTMAKPVLPPEPTAPVEIPPVQEITPAWIWAIIGIGAVLVIAVIVLIVTTRRVP